MKMNVILKTVVVILFTALLSVGNMVGQVSATSATHANIQTTTMSAAQISATRAQAVSVLASILDPTNKVPAELYPPGYIAQLKGTANGTLPANKMIMFQHDH